MHPRVHKINLIYSFHVSLFPYSRAPLLDDGYLCFNFFPLPYTNWKWYAFKTRWLSQLDFVICVCFWSLQHCLFMPGPFHSLTATLFLFLYRRWLCDMRLVFVIWNWCFDQWYGEAISKDINKISVVVVLFRQGVRTYIILVSKFMVSHSMSLFVSLLCKLFSYINFWDLLV